MERTACTICNDSLHMLYEMKDMPASLTCVSEDACGDTFQTQTVCYCETCSCVQLSKLIDPNILYRCAHNLTFTLPLWNEHHEAFSNFIKDGYKYNTIMEIGGSSGALYNKLKDTDLVYSCIDLCPANFDTSCIEYIVGNCEEYAFNNVTSVALSHVFEHLYKPNVFIENIAKTGIQSVYISIPNMTKLLENDSCSILHYEHTYYVDKYLTMYMFAQYGFKLTKYTEFKTHSIFMLFERDGISEPFQLVSRPEIVDKMRSIYENMHSRFLKHTIPSNSFIVPGGHMGQLVYTVLKPPSILGFLDNDVAKQNKRLYGTPHQVYSFSKLTEINEPVNVYIYAGPYLPELQKQLSVYTNVTVHVI